MASTQSEYYLKNIGNPCIEQSRNVDLENDNWTWFVHGADRVAKIRPKNYQQPKNITTSPSVLNDTLEAAFYLYDHLGNARLVYTPKIQCPEFMEYTIDFTADYYPYGKTLRLFDSEEEKFLTTQHERDVETGLDYRGARFYDSDVARFLSLDPHAKNYSSWSDYNYVLGNPVMFIDPDGKSPNDIIRLNSEGIVIEVIQNNAINTFFDENGNELYLNDKTLDNNALVKEYSVGDKVFEKLNLAEVLDGLEDAGTKCCKAPNDAAYMMFYSIEYAYLSHTYYDFGFNYLQDRLGVTVEEMTELYYGSGYVDGIPYILFENTNTLYNLPDAGNFMWGMKGRDNGVPLGFLLYGAAVNEGGEDTEADTEAIKKGVNY